MTDHKDNKKEELLEILESRSFTDEDIEILIRLVKFYEKYEIQLKEIVDREIISQLWHAARQKMGKMVKWILGSFLLLIAVLQGWQTIIEMFFKDSK
jgi:hypothetical protein